MDWDAADALDVVQALAAHFGFGFAEAVDFLLARQLQQAQHDDGEAQQQQQPLPLLFIDAGVRCVCVCVLPPPLLLLPALAPPERARFVVFLLGGLAAGGPMAS